MAAQKTPAAAQGGTSTPDSREVDRKIGKTWRLTGQGAGYAIVDDATDEQLAGSVVKLLENIVEILGLMSVLDPQDGHHGVLCLTQIALNTAGALADRLEVQA